MMRVSYQLSTSVFDLCASFCCQLLFLLLLL